MASNASTPAPPPLRVLISGAGIAGPALALHLTRLPPPLKCDITIVERHPTLRTTGQQIDLRGQGIDAMRVTGLEPQVRAIVVNEPGLRYMDRRGRTVAYMASNKTGKGAQTFSAEWEIMRGDLCRVLYEATVGLDGVRYVFGKTVEEIAQPLEAEQKRKGPVRVRFDDGSEGEYDLLVGCDGVGSRTRRRMFTDGRKENLLHVGAWFALFSVPPRDGDTADATYYHLPGRRTVMTRRDRPDCLRVALGYAGDDERLFEAIRHGTVAEQKEAWANLFRHDMHQSWNMERYLDGMLHSAEAEQDFYTQELVQVRLDSWSEGRVVLLGDSAFCPCPLTGFGTSLALAGAYVLAGEIARACSRAHSAGGGGAANPWDAIPDALAAYETTLRPLVTHVQDMPVRTIVRYAIPKSGWVITFYQWMFWLLIGVLRIDKLLARFGSDDKGQWKLPIYPELSSPAYKERK
ncbi:uncharacterized protein THITE_2109194 [Thermothielavioides terrestris NRRL 8126]|uniref:FAD-binding domain-containing protein n=1 Tax=Thermothielavioides terrestris (strain ATCC 38088 / NRRL 8126) TaxID=578455 RepID=G2QU00_THETT|nr:uncharacterized protein THITE_2109194 [Thermothielavioides terrestris NRRL 8126]AEO63659.1 hypothetical protein THITE_2109194 [Thermothielavioides terrestris NRRL 8126]